jgi:hypothetical protein
MPHIPITDARGRLAKNAFGLARGAMYFPAPGAERERRAIANQTTLAKGLNERWESRINEQDHYPVEFNLEMMGDALSARDLSDLVRSAVQVQRDGYIAGQWLRFRLFAAMHHPRLNSNARWVDYASAYLMPNMPQSNTWEWPEDRKKLKAAVRAFGPVAHLWAAATQTEAFRSAVRADPDAIERDVGMPMAFAFRGSSFLRLANGYLQAALAAGAYGNANGLVPVDDVWTLPAEYGSEAPDLTRPDDFIVVDYDRLILEYCRYEHTDKSEKPERQRAVRLRPYDPPPYVAPEPPPPPQKARPHWLRIAAPVKRRGSNAAIPSKSSAGVESGPPTA